MGSLECGVGSPLLVPVLSADEDMLGATSTPGTGLPGTFGVDYAFINKSAIDVFVDQNKVSGQDLPDIERDCSVLISSRSTSSA